MNDLRDGPTNRAVVFRVHIERGVAVYFAPYVSAVVGCSDACPLVAGPVALDTPPDVRRVDVETALESASAYAMDWQTTAPSTRSGTIWPGCARAASPARTWFATTSASGWRGR